MLSAGQSILLAPFVMLPFIYVTSHMFTREMSAVMFLFIYQLLIQFIAPWMVMASRLNYDTEESGDNTYRNFKAVPLFAPMSTILNNS